MKNKMFLSSCLIAFFSSSTYAGTMGAEFAGSNYQKGLYLGASGGYGYLSTFEPTGITVIPPATASVNN